ncbi:MAG: FHA domain-containing protein [Planctomycetales bacterium]|nr:FHA domain-containing protein [Planctomycetales bacterium]
MALVTLRVIDGADRGRVFQDLQTPFTIGREEGNTVQLNDERISRFHVKIQEDQEKLVLTDLESTNGSKVNGEDIQLRILRYGDIIHVGRSLLLYGTREQIGERLARLRAMEGSDSKTFAAEQLANRLEAASLDFDLEWGDDLDIHSTMHTVDPPALPENLGPGQAAQLCEMLEYFHLRIRELLNTVETKGAKERITLDLGQWQNLVDVQSRLAEYMRSIAEPPSTDHGDLESDESAPDV